MTKQSTNLLFIYGVLFVFVLYAPALIMVMFSFNDAIYVAFPLKGFTLRWYEEMVSNPQLMAAFRNSIKVGAVVAVISTAIALLAAMALTRYNFGGKAPITAVSLVPLVIPSIILGLALLMIIRKGLDLPLSLYTIGAGHVLIATPFSMLVLMSRLEGFDKSLEEASWDLGENGWHTFWRVTFPLALPGIVASLLLAFTTSFDEYVVAAFLSGNQATMPIYIFSSLRFPTKLPATLALGATILVVSFFITVFAEMLRRRGVDAGAKRSAI